MNNFETITQDLYDTVPYSTTACMFQHPVGLGEGRNGTKSFADTNMFISGQLPSGQSFVITGISIKLLSENPNIKDERKFYSKGYFQLRIGNKNYITNAPIGKNSGDNIIPEIVIKFISQGNSVNITTDKDGVPEPFNLTPNNLWLVSHQNFLLQLFDLPKLKYKAWIHAKLHGVLTRSIY